MTEFKRFLTDAQVKELAAKFNKKSGFGREIYGIKTPMFQKGSDISKDLANAIVESLASRGMGPQKDDIFAVTEAVAAKDITQGVHGNIVSPESVTESFKTRTGGGHAVLANPIYSRNRMAHIVQPFSKGVKELSIVLGLTEDEQGNSMINRDEFWKHQNRFKNDKLYTKAQVEERTERKMVHGITGKNYGDIYEGLGDNINVRYAISPAVAASKIKADAYVAGDVHTRSRTMSSLSHQSGFEQKLKQLIMGQHLARKNVLSLADIMNMPLHYGDGYNTKFGLLGSNKLGDLIKLFPREDAAEKFLRNIIGHVEEMTGVRIEQALVFGDGAYKDPVEGIWELADPVVAPASIGLEGMPNEIKVKDRNEYYKSQGLSDLEAAAYTQYEIDNKKENMQNLGTTPRKLKNLIGSAADLTAGSGDKATPVVYFRNY